MTSVDQKERARMDSAYSHMQQRAPRPATLALDTWAQVVSHQLASVQAFWDELASIEARGYRRWRDASEQLARMGSDSVTDLTVLAAELRQLPLAFTRRMRTSLSPAGWP
jgi:hypothetical protein